MPDLFLKTSKYSLLSKIIFEEQICFGKIIFFNVLYKKQTQPHPATAGLIKGNDITYKFLSEQNI